MMEMEELPYLFYPNPAYLQIHLPRDVLPDFFVYWISLHLKMIECLWNKRYSSLRPLPSMHVVFLWAQQPRDNFLMAPSSVAIQNRKMGKMKTQRYTSEFHLCYIIIIRLLMVLWNIYLNDMFISPYMAKVKCKYPTLPSPQSQDFVK